MMNDISKIILIECRDGGQCTCFALSTSKCTIYQHFCAEQEDCNSDGYCTFPLNDSEECRQALHALVAVCEKHAATVDDGEVKIRILDENEVSEAYFSLGIDFSKTFDDALKEAKALKIDDVIPAVAKLLPKETWPPVVKCNLK